MLVIAMQIVVEYEEDCIYCENNNLTYYLYDDAFVTVEAVAKIKIHAEYVELLYINVNREYRGNGKGTYLLNRIINDFNNRKVIVETFEERVNWYKKFGFNIISSHANLYKLERPRTYNEENVQTPMVN